LSFCTLPDEILADEVKGIGGWDKYLCIQSKVWAAAENSWNFIDYNLVYLACFESSTNSGKVGCVASNAPCFQDLYGDGRLTISITV